MNNELFFKNAGDERGTPQALYDRLHAKYKFDLDVAASSLNHKCDLWLGDGGIAYDGLDFDWLGFRCFMNPPYSVIFAWVQKAYETMRAGGFVVGVLPCRTETKFWHQFIWDADLGRPNDGVQIEFCKGRLSFELHLTDEQRAFVRDLEGPYNDDIMKMADIVDQTGLPKMAIEGIWQGKEDDDLLSGAPFPSCVVTWGKP